MSVVIPSYNHAQFIDEAIESALRQNHANVEVVVVDDGSTDNTRAVVARHERVRYIYQRNLGLARARNTGLDASTGEFVVFLDADDRLLPEALAVGVRELTNRPECAFVSGEHRYINADGRITATWSRSLVLEGHYRALLMNNYIGMIATVLFRKRTLLSIGGFDPRWRACEDYDVYLRLARRYSVASHGYVVAEYRRYRGAMSDDPARMLSAALGVLQAQRFIVQRDGGLAAALEAGVMYWRRSYGPQLATRARQHWTERRAYLAAVCDTMTLFRLSPASVLKVFRARQDSDTSHAATRT